MSTQEPGRASGPGLTPLPRTEDLPTSAQGYDRARVEEAFDAFRRHVTALQANLRVLQAAPRRGVAEPSGHAVRMDALHLIRSAAEFADTIERDAQEAATKQVAKAEQEIRESQMDLQQQEAEIARIRQETERQRSEILNAARKEAREILSNANQDSSAEMRQAEASGARLLEQARHQATELTNSARAEVEQTLEWARQQADVIVQRSRMGAEQLLGAAGHGDPAIQRAVDAIVEAARATTEASRRPPERPAGSSALTQAPAAPEGTRPADAPAPAGATPVGEPPVPAEPSGPDGADATADETESGTDEPDVR
jgi:F0F1-type ATP synthase membrane subunit b/b'